MGLLFRDLFDTRFISFPLTLYVVHSVGCPDPVRREQKVLLMTHKMCGQPRRLLTSCIKCIFYDCNTKCSTNMTKYGMLDDRPLQSYDGGKTVKTFGLLLTL